MTARQIRLTLSLEEASYPETLEKVGRMAENAVKKCRLLDTKRALAVESLDMEAERYRLAQVRQELGRLTRLELMEARLDCVYVSLAN